MKTSESADAARVVLRNDLSAGPQFSGTHQRCQSDLPGLDKRPGFTVPTANGCVPSLNLRMAVTIVETFAQTRAITGGVDTHADVHVAAALDDVGGLPVRRDRDAGGDLPDLDRLAGLVGGGIDRGHRARVEADDVGGLTVRRDRDG